ncbi:MAG: outer membrane beta-barrel protein [Bacteroidaceae bacterium]|nr:outer membrane beta-barrel protein [Bacteroidaceae bacterium]
MKKIVLTFLLLTSLSASAQEKRWEHHIYVGSGVLLDNKDGRIETGFTAKLGYGINYYFSNRWSVRPGIDYRAESSSLLDNSDGGDGDFFQYIDIPIAVQFHSDDHWVVGLAPVLTFCVDRDEWYIDADPQDPLNGKSKIKMFNLGLQPSITYQWKHVGLGVESYIGLFDVSDTHGLMHNSSRKRRFSNVVAVLGVRF